MKEIIESSSVSTDGNTAIFKTGNSGMHLRPLTTLAKILKEFTCKHGIDIVVILYDKDYRETHISLDKVGPLNFDLLQITNGRLFGVRIVPERLESKELLSCLVKEIEGMESIGRSVPKAVSRVFQDI